MSSLKPVPGGMIKGAHVFDKASQRTADGFRNFMMKLGVGPLGQNNDNQLSGGFYQFNLLTRNRIQLEAAYRGSWIVGRVVDCQAEDMTKAGIIMSTNDGADKIQDFKVQMSRLQIWQSIRDTIKWGRLYGGAIGVLQIDGQDLESPLDPSTIEEGQFRGIAVYDRWQIYPVLSRIIEAGPDIGLPAYYDIVLGSNLNNPGQVPGQGSQTVAPFEGSHVEAPLGEGGVKEYTGQTAGGPSSSRVRIHHTRCFRMGGHKLPFYQAITEMMWDESIIERMWDRLIEFDTATASIGGLIGRANLRTISLDGFREIMAAGGEGQQTLVSMFETMREFQNNEGLTLLDKNDVFQSTAYSFAGLSDVLERFGEQVSGSAETPLVRLFGQSPGGLNSNGEADERNYFDAINAKQEANLRNPVEVIAQVMWPSCFGEPLPKDFGFTFSPLRQMTAKEKSEITTSLTTAIIGAHGDGLVPTPTAMKELKQMSADTGVFTNITDEDIAEAEMEPAPMPDTPEEPVDPAMEGAEAGDPGGNPVSPIDDPENKVKKNTINANDSAWRKLRRMFGPSPAKDVGVEATIKEFEKGTLKSSSGKKVTSKKQALAIGYSEEGKDGKRSMSKDQKAIDAWMKQNKN